MASIKVKFRPSTTSEREGRVYYQILHQRIPRQLITEYYILPTEWDEQHSRLVTTTNESRRSLIFSIRERIRWDIERLTKIIHQLESSGLAYSADDIVEEFKRYSLEYTVSNYMEHVIAKLKLTGKTRTAETYTSTLNNFKKFMADKCTDNKYGNDILLDHLNSGVLEEYEAWNRRRGLTLNTISFYQRILRATYNRAVEDGIIDNKNPFRHVYTGIDKTVKRALPLEVIKRIKTLDFSLRPSLDFARDMFMLSFMLRGMSFIDMAFLRKTDLANGYVSYRRRKTGQLLTIKWTGDMQAILDKYPENNTDYLLPIIRNRGTNERFVYHNVGYKINQNLKKIATLLDIPMPLTLYVARHSWASAAKAKGVPLSVISEGMGHDSETTTQIYLASLDTTLVDQANNLILDSL